MGIWTGKLAEDGEYEVDTVSLDDLVFLKKFPPPKVIKIDVEGREILVLEGAKKLLKEMSPTLFIEIKEFDKCYNLFISSGYKLELIKGSNELFFAYKV